MAADTRPYKSKEQDGQGNELIIRDQQLVEQASQTTMASGEYFEIVDVDGRMAKIPKANMVDIVREALGSLLNGLTDQTTVTKVPSLNGNTLGASTVATLASVLGVMKKKSIPIELNAASKLSGKGIIMAVSLQGASQNSNAIIIYSNYGSMNGTVLKVEGDTVFSGIKNNPGTVNFYTENEECYIQNKWVNIVIYYTILQSY